VSQGMSLCRLLTKHYTQHRDTEGTEEHREDLELGHMFASDRCTVSAIEDNSVDMQHTDSFVVLCVPLCSLCLCVEI